MYRLSSGVRRDLLDVVQGAPGFDATP